ncbi:InlB B-repeat-containing protein [Carnobacteriaceae bacterium zg-ZUI78]|nr:InlB B-repeat-containing protein [Carnobacteriaceae bacterium zg-ZUI78]
MKTVKKKWLIWFTVLLLVVQSTNLYYSGTLFAEEQQTEQDNSNIAGNLSSEYDVDTVDQTLQATIYQDASYQELAEEVSTITLSGKMPQGATVKAYPAEVPTGDETVLFAYDITIYDTNGRVFNPKESDSIQVSVSNPVLENASNIKIYHVEGNTQQKEEVIPKETQDDTVTFDAKSFSVYIGTGLSRHKVHTYRFYDEQGQELYVRRLSTGEKLSKPPTVYKDGYVFTGWYTAQTGGTKFEDNKFTVEGPLRNDQETKLYARYQKAYFVRYLSKSQQGAPAWFTQKYPRSDGNDVLDFKNIPFVADDGKVLTGWSRTLDGRTPVAEGTAVTSDMDLYPIIQDARWIYFETNGAESLSPVYVLSNQQNNTKKPADPVRKGYTFAGWFADKDLRVPFNWNTTPQSDTTIYAKWTPSKTSYTIVYWKQKVTHPLGQADPNHEDYDYWKSTVVPNIDTGSATPTSVPLSDERGFEFSSLESTHDKIKGDGSTVINVYYNRKVVTINFYDTLVLKRDRYGNPVTNYKGELQYYYRKSQKFDAENRSLYDHHPKHNSRPIALITREPDGRYTVRQNNRDRTFLQNLTDEDIEKLTKPFATLKGLWEASIPNFPNNILFEGKKLYYSYYIGGEGDNATHTTYWPDFKFDDRHMESSGSYIVNMRLNESFVVDKSYEVRFLKEGLVSNQYDETDSVIQYVKEEPNVSNLFTLTDKFAGFTIKEYAVRGTNNWQKARKNGQGEFGGDGNNYDVRMTRNRYTIDYKYGDAMLLESKSDIVFETPLDASYNLNEPSRPANIPSHYVWKGWALDPAGSKFIKFDGSYKMDASNLVLYAIWKPVDVTVTFDSNGGSPVPSQPLASGDSAKKPTDPTRPNYRFAGWKLNGNLYSFNSEVNRNITLVAQWIPTTVANLYYHPNTATGEIKKATNSDFPDVDGKVEKIETNWSWRAPATSDGFVSWNTKADGTGTTYYPGDAIPLPAGDTYLYAQWSENRKVDVTYHFNYPSIYANKQPNPLVQQFEANDDNAKIGGNNSAKFFGNKLTLAGYKFLGWSTQPTGNTEFAQTGDKFHVDTLNKERANALYARWQREALITVKKEVHGNQIDQNTPNREFTFRYKIHLPGSRFGVRSNIDGQFTLRPGETKTLEQITADQSDPEKRYSVLPEGAGIQIWELKNDHDQDIETWKSALNNPTNSRLMEKKAIGSVTDNNGVKTWEYVTNESSDNAHVVFKNTKIASPPTGLFFDSVPAMLLSGFALIAILYIVLFQKRGRHYDD